MEKKSIILFCILVLSVIPVVNATESEDWLGNWQQRIQFTIDADSINETLTDFPLLLNVSSSSGISETDLTCLFTCLCDDSTKIAITNSSHNQLYYEIEYWNSTEQQAYIWFKAPTISNTSDTVFYLYYDNTQDGSTYHIKENVWDSNFKLVCHMNDNPNATSVMDSTSNDNDGTKKDINKPLETVGTVGKAQNFDEINTDYINCGNNESLDFTSEDITIEFWFTPKKINDFQHVFCRGAYNADGWRVTFSTSEQIGFTTYQGASNQLSSSSILTIDVLYHVVIIRSGSDVDFYINNVLVNGTGIHINPVTSSRDLFLGVYDDGVSQPLTAIIDEFRFSKGVIRSLGWVGVSYQTQIDSLFSFSGFENIPTIFKLTNFVFMALSISVLALVLIVSEWKK